MNESTPPQTETALLSRAVQQVLASWEVRTSANRQNPLIIQLCFGCLLLLLVLLFAVLLLFTFLCDVNTRVHVGVQESIKYLSCA